jgi:hypothetical protein
MADDEALARQAALDQEKAVEQFKIKKLIKSLHEARGAGTSMISLVIPPRDQIARVSKMLADEYGTASNIKSRVNRQSVLSAITSTTQRLKLYSKVTLLFVYSAFSFQSSKIHCCAPDSMTLFRVYDLISFRFLQTDLCFTVVL